MSKLKVQTALLAFKDVANASAPKQKAVDWVSSADLDCHAVYSEHFELVGGAQKTIAEANAGTWSTATTIDLAAHPSDPSLVLVKAAAFSVTYIGVAEATTVITNPDGTITLSRTTTFANYFPGTRIALRGPTESGPFSGSNEGVWEVVRKTGPSALVLRRVSPSAPLGAAEVVATPDVNSIYVVGAPGAYGTKLYVSGGEAFGVGGVYPIVEQGDGWVAVTAPEASTGVSFTGDVGVSLDSLNYIRIEADRPVDVSVAVKGAAVVIPIFPIEPGVKSGWFEYRGPFGAVTVKNLSSEPANVSFVFALEKANG